MANSLNQNETQSELRSAERFIIQDKRHWQSKINDKKLPIDWISDISRFGAKIKQPICHNYVAGDYINLDFRYDGKARLNVRGKVLWLQQSSKDLNMNVLGIEFEGISGKKNGAWMTKGLVRNALFPLKMKEERALREELEEAKKRSWLSEIQWVSAVLIPFTLGYALSFMDGLFL